VRCRAILKGFPLKVNISLLAIAVICAIISGFSNKDSLRNICLAIGWLLTLAAVVPSLFWSRWELARRGKAKCVKDPDTVVPGWKQLCQSMGIEEDIKVKVFPNSRNAYRDGTTIEIGQPVLDNLDSVSIKAVFAHELAHVKEGRTRNKIFSLAGVPLAVLMLLFVRYGVGPLDSLIFGLSFFLVLVDYMGIAARFVLWPLEYKADLIAKQYVNRDAVVSYLTIVAALRKMDVTRDFYRHPSINKRIANLDWPQKTRFKKWYFEL
jgi:Zn-dependent protease with chaperone function